MNEEKILKAFSVVAAELYIQNTVSVLAAQGHKPGSTYLKDKSHERLAEHFNHYFTGSDLFSPGSIVGIDLSMK